MNNQLAIDTLMLAIEQKKWALVGQVVDLLESGPSEYRVPLKSGQIYPVPQNRVDDWCALYGRVLTHACLREIVRWNTDHTEQRKTVKGINKHIGDWISREFHKGAKGGGPRTVGGEYGGRA